MADNSLARLMRSNAVAELSADSTVHGILLRHPVLARSDERAACTPGGIIRLLDAFDVDPAGKGTGRIAGSVV